MNKNRFIQKSTSEETLNEHNINLHMSEHINLHLSTLSVSSVSVNRTAPTVSATTLPILRKSTLNAPITTLPMEIWVRYWRCCHSYQSRQPAMTLHHDKFNLSFLVYILGFDFKEIRLLEKDPLAKQEIQQSLEWHFDDHLCSLGGWIVSQLLKFTRFL